MYKKIFKILSVIFTFISLWYISFSFWNDIMSQSFYPSKEYGTVIYIWDTKKDVWHSILRDSTSIWWIWIYQEAPLIVRIVKIILRITIVLSITMVIFYGIKFMIQVFNWNDYKSAWAKKDLINLFIWLLIALFSITAVNLIISASNTVNTLDSNTQLDI